MNTLEALKHPEEMFAESNKENLEAELDRRDIFGANSFDAGYHQGQSDVKAIATAPEIAGVLAPEVYLAKTPRIGDNSTTHVKGVDAGDIVPPKTDILPVNNPIKQTLIFGQDNRKLGFLFNKNIDPINPKNVQRARGNADRIGIADTPSNRAEVTKLFNDAFNDPSSIVPGGSNVPGRNLREFFLPGVTGAGSKVQFVEEAGKVITIITK